MNDILVTLFGPVASNPLASAALDEYPLSKAFLIINVALTAIVLSLIIYKAILVVVHTAASGKFAAGKIEDQFLNPVSVIIVLAMVVPLGGYSLSQRLIISSASFAFALADDVYTSTRTTRVAASSLPRVSISSIDHLAIFKQSVCAQNEIKDVMELNQAIAPADPLPLPTSYTYNNGLIEFADSARCGKSVFRADDIRYKVAAAPAITTYLDTMQTLAVEYVNARSIDYNAAPAAATNGASFMDTFRTRSEQANKTLLTALRQVSLPATTTTASTTEPAVYAAGTTTANGESTSFLNIIYDSLTILTNTANAENHILSLEVSTPAPAPRGNGVGENYAYIMRALDGMDTEPQDTNFAERIIKNVVCSDTADNVYSCITHEFLPPVSTLSEQASFGKLEIMSGLAIYTAAAVLPNPATIATIPNPAYDAVGAAKDLSKWLGGILIAWGIVNAIVMPLLPILFFITSILNYVTSVVRALFIIPFSMLAAMLRGDNVDLKSVFPQFLPIIFLPALISAMAVIVYILADALMSLLSYATSFFAARVTTLSDLITALLIAFVVNALATLCVILAARQFAALPAKLATTLGIGGQKQEDIADTIASKVKV